MSDKAAAKFNFILKTSTTLGGAYTELVRFRAGSTPDMSKGMIRVDDIQDDWQKFKSGKKKLNEMTFEALLTKANLAAVYAHFDVDPGADNKFYQILWPLETGEATARTDTFEGVLNTIKGSSLDGMTEDTATIPFTIQPSGELTIVAAA